MCIAVHCAFHSRAASWHLTGVWHYYIDYYIIYTTQSMKQEKGEGRMLRKNFKTPKDL